MTANLFRAVTQRKQARSARVSSWDQSGGNEDAFVILPGETLQLADLEGPGAITHLWFTQACRRVIGPGLFDPRNANVAAMETGNANGINFEVNDPDYYRKILFKIYWDDQEAPSVLAPLGDFFCIGHSMAANFESLPFTVSVREADRFKYGGAAGCNCYLTMPFNKRARIEVENQNDIAYVQYFYIDYELYTEPIGEDTLYFHAHWRRENTTDGWGPDLQVNSMEVEVPHLDAKGNYVVLETKGTGNYIGCNLSVVHFQGSWWGEGDDMIFIDDDTWPPSLHGTGSEDYFSQAWGMQKNAFSFAGSIIHESDVPGCQVSYRWHLADPVRFDKRIKVTLEHGHANHLSDDWASTAYWYQTLPGPALEMLPPEKRVPRRAQMPTDGMHIPDRNNLDKTRQAMHRQRDERMEEFMARRNEWFQRRATDSKECSRKSVQIARDVRSRFLEQMG